MLKTHFFQIGNDFYKWFFTKELLQSDDALSICLFPKDNRDECLHVEEYAFAIAEEMF